MGFLIFFLNSFAFGEVIYLKNGKTVEGEITERDSHRIKIETNGISLTYYMDEIERIGDVVIQPAELVTPEVIKKDPSLSVATPGPAGSSISARSASSKDELVKQLIEVSGAKKNLVKIYNDMLAQASLEEIEQIRAIFRIEEIIAELIPVYNKYFTESELAELVRFYNSKAVKKMMQNSQALMQESVQATLNYFQKKLQAQQMP